MSVRPGTNCLSSKLESTREAPQRYLELSPAHGLIAKSRQYAKTSCLGHGIFLSIFPALLLFLPKFGQFMLTAVVAAFLYAMCVFTALLAVLGPVGEQGRLHLGALRA